MKKFLTLVLVSILALSLVACGGDNGGEETACKVKIGLVTDTGGVDDRSFNQSSWEGLLKYAEEMGQKDCVSYLQSTAEADYVPNLSQYAEDGYDMVIAVGFLFDKALAEVAPMFPDTKFLFIDSFVDSPNVNSAAFSAEQGGYLVGLAAGLEAKNNGSNKIGFMGGVEMPVLQAFQAGYEQGALEANPDVTIYVDYADSFSDDAKGQQLANKQYSEGATVVFQAAGNAGNGVIKEAKERGDVWAIGVDKDQYNDGVLDSGKSIILTSMLKRVDQVVYHTAMDLYNGVFEGGEHVFSLANDGVGFEATSGRNLSDETIEFINGYAEKIKAGELEVSPLPMIKNGSHN